MIRRLTWIEARLLAREPLTLLVGVMFPLVLLALLGTSFGNDPDPDFGGVGGTDFYVAVYATATVAVMGLLGVPTHLAAYRQEGVLRRFRASGVEPATYMTSQLVITGLIVLVGSGLAVVLGVTTADLTLPASGAGVLIGLVVGTVAFTAMGLALGALLPTARAAQGVGLLLFFGLFFIAGGGPPPAILPDAVNDFAEVTPIGLVIAAVSEPWHQGHHDVASLLALGAIALVAGLVAHRLLHRE